MDLGRQGGGKTQTQLLLPLLRELRRKVHCAQCVHYNNKANMLNLSSYSSVFFSTRIYTIHRYQIERHESQWKALKDSSKNVCIVREAITLLQK